ncbi:hypothetical protein WOLCODRAFT_96517 [Wolfiporia cocos MD-104 SS10]|uniref:Voltage-gated hydrogen channel 1 n=1 Tax=Wolfiporia cocos (strain MD-104) TaxID=742152 RepID=A0A2H3J772_WOLCO|nr:hypothetical protein WOLCODRAFT_96517 [Wolfiporia cocos MD-104 SS10]
MSEREPLLPSHNAYEADQAEALSSKYITRQEQTAEFLESRRLHKTVIALARIPLTLLLSMRPTCCVLLDSACVLADLSYTFLDETCAPNEEDQPLWLTVLAYVSLAINSLFLIEIPIATWAFGWRYYKPGSHITHSSLHFFDAVVIITTFVLEVVLRGRERELASLLIVLRLWRLVKLVQGIAVSAGELEEGDAQQLAETRQELEGVIVALADAREENQRLRERLRVLEHSEI